MVPSAPAGNGSSGTREPCVPRNPNYADSDEVSWRQRIAGGDSRMASVSLDKISAQTAEYALLTGTFRAMLVSAPTY